jgi:hypothetical protein
MRKSCDILRPERLDQPPGSPKGMFARQCVLLFPGAPYPYECVLLRAKPLEQMVLEKEHGRMRTLEEAKKGG